MCLAVAGVLALGASVPSAFGASIAERTSRVSVAPGGAAADGGSSHPSLSPAGLLAVFDSAAANLAAGDGNGSVRDVFVRDLGSQATSLVSVGLGGAPADGPSERPVVSGGARQVVFTSLATNLVAGDMNDRRDVFARSGGGPIVPVSLTDDERQGNGASFEPDVSRDGRRVVFTSLASDLVPNDLNGVEDVFVRDLEAGTTRRVSELAGGVGFSGRSRAPAISPDGGWVCFESTASDVVPGDDNKVPDVFLAELATGTIRLVSVSSRERHQNRAVEPGFVTACDVSSEGRFVAWDSDATNLVPRDLNRDSDVFVRDVLGGRTSLVSRASTGEQGNNDSYFPSVSENGRYVSFSSFARNLWTFDRGDEDVFVHDRTLGTTSLMTVTSRSSRRGPELTRQLLRRPALSDGARRVAFTSTADLAGDSADRVEDVFVRSTDAPVGRIASLRGRRYRFTADDPRATFLCQIDSTPPFFCGRSGLLPRVTPGRHRLEVRATGPGMLYQDKPAVRSFRVR